MRTQVNVRLPGKLAQLIRSDATRYKRTTQSILEKLAADFYSKKRSDREPMILSIPPRGSEYRRVD